MKTKPDIEADIESCLNEIKLMEKPGTKSTKLRNKLTHLRSLIIYLEHNPREDALRSDLAMCRMKLEIPVPPNPTIEEVKNNEAMKDKMKKQVKTLEYLLT